MKTIVIYSDENFYYHTLNTIESFRRVNSHFKFLYFQIGFNKPVYIYNIDVEIMHIPLDKNLPSMTLWKPTVLKTALEIVDEYIYIDVDTIVSKNFNYNTLLKEITDKPYGCRLHETEWQYPIYWKYIDGVRVEYNEQPLMDLLSVKLRSQPWVTTLVLGVNKNCVNFIDEWVNISINNNYLNPNIINHDFRYYFQLGDETIYNVLLWKYHVSNYYKTDIIIEPKEISTIIKIETTEISKVQVESENLLSYVNDSKNIHLYHQLKDLNFRYETLYKLKKYA